MVAQLRIFACVRDDISNRVSFSGHRSFKALCAPADLFAAERSQAPEAVAARLREVLLALVDEGYGEFLCGMAEGFDMMAGEAVAALRRDCPGVRLVAVVPFPGQAHGFDHELRRRYDDLLAAADQIVTVCQRYSHECFHMRNDYLVDNSSALVCYYNGSPGGTEYTVRRALRNGLKVINLV